MASPLGGSCWRSRLMRGQICGNCPFPRRGNKIIPRGRGGALPRPRFCGNAKITGQSVGAVIDRPGNHPDKSTCRANFTGERCSPLQPTGQICANRTISRRGGVTPPYIAIKYPHHKKRNPAETGLRFSISRYCVIFPRVTSRLRTLPSRSTCRVTVSPTSLSCR